MRSCSIVLAIRKAKSKTTFGDCYVPTRMAVIKSIDNNKCWQGYGAIRTTMCCCQECKMVQMFQKKITHVAKQSHS